MTVTLHATVAEASLDLAAKIVARWGADPEIIPELHFGALRTPHAGSDRSGITIFCHPKNGIRDPDELLVSYFGDAPLFLDA